MGEVKKFSLDRLPKVSRQDMENISLLTAFLPRFGMTDQIPRAVKRLVSRNLGVPFSFKRLKVSNVPFRQVVQKLPRQGVYLVLGAAPLEERAFLEIDPFMIHLAVDKLLGGRDEPPTMMRPPTEVEQGVLSYLFLKILHAIFEKSGRSAKVHFRLEGFRFSANEILEMQSTVSEEDCLLVTFRIEMGDRSGYARLILPAPFVQNVLVEDGSEGAVPKNEVQHYASRLEGLGFLETSLWVEIGKTTLEKKDFGELEPGDVVLLEETQVRLENKKLAGTLPVRLGQGLCGSFRGSLVSQDGPMQVKLEGVELEHSTGGF